METSMISSAKIMDSTLSDVSNELEPNYFFSIERGQNKASLEITPRNLDQFAKKFAHKEYVDKRKEDFYILGFKNLLKQKRFLELSLELSDDLITEEEYETEIEENFEKYTIQLNNLDDINDLKIIEHITNKIGENFSIDEVSEIFSISCKSMNKALSL